MNTLVKWVLRILAIGFVLLFVALIFGYYMLSRSLPDYQYDDPIAFGDYQVEILRDLQAVPHIYGEERKDAFFALGFAHAQDRLWQMESARRLVQGRLSEVFGEDLLEIDRFYRALDLWNLSDRAARSLPAEELALMQSYSDGVNAYIQDINKNRRGSGAPEFLLFSRTISPWTPTDSIALIKYMAFETSSQAENEIVRAKLASVLDAQSMRDIFYDVKLPVTFDQLQYPTRVSEYDPSPLAQAFNPEKGFDNKGASNAFIVGKSRTTNGEPILANDPHLKLSAPTIWMLAHMHVNKTGEDFYGGTIPGIPLVLIGRNLNLAWGLTTAYLDDQDLVILKRASGGYENNGQIVPFQSEVLGISIKDQDAPYEYQREVSEFGPIIPPGGPWKIEEISSEDQAVALSWTALEENDHTIIAGFDLMFSRSVNDAIRALDQHKAPSQVVSLVDKAGNTAQLAAGIIPIRAQNHPSLGTMPTPNWVGDVGFKGYFPQSENPRLQNPKDDLLIHTNNKIVQAPFPRHFSYYWGDVYRRLRATELLANRKFHTPASMMEAQNDEISEAARVLLPLIAREFWFSPGQSKQRAEVLDLLANWTGEFDALRPEPLIFAAWIEELNNMIFSDELGPNLYKSMGRVDPLRLERVFRNVDGGVRWCDVKPSPAIETCPEIAEASLDRALEKLTEKYGANIEIWRWGRAHHAVHKNAVLSRVPIFGSLSNIIQEQSGDTQTLLRLAYPGGEDYNFDADHGAGLRMVVDFSNLDTSKIITATGQSGHILSSHYDDLSTLWRSGEYINMNTNRQVIEGNLIGRIEFNPSGEPLVEDAVEN